jgi:hypothetical protein
VTLLKALAIKTSTRDKLIKEVTFAFENWKNLSCGERYCSVLNVWSESCRV